MSDKDKPVTIATNQQAGGGGQAAGPALISAVVFAEGQRLQVEARKTSPCSARISCAATVQLVFLALAVLVVLDLIYPCSADSDSDECSAQSGEQPTQQNSLAA